ncbi:MAG: flagellar export chaperone FliS [Ruminiclostridium sp.]|nr:flagellar export chaperone FliS [Ruminiclostridium sp.]
MTNALSAYKKQSVTTLTPGEVVVRLYMEAERQLNRASYYIPQKNFEGANKALTKAQDVVNALRSCLDMKIPISKNLDSLYEYFNREIVEANVKKDKAKVDALIPMIAELREAFQEINSMSREQMMAQQQQATTPQGEAPQS